ncbi:hypothetical protein KIH74_06320 [Kineosporia sp. J2-2]|uniref:Uncharacterized protein n=1 Tax=Kineosporia corallincola TaxID=2835133 RepID=A0ABS5TBR9_9ACTN|nr:hypothetical protein [Kineosporia corallincola]MBT0768532.1 hypothetical protein [Kineosporia corallincola]
MTPQDDNIGQESPRSTEDRPRRLAAGIATDLGQPQANIGGRRSRHALGYETSAGQLDETAGEQRALTEGLDTAPQPCAGSGKRRPCAGSTTISAR